MFALDGYLLVNGEERTVLEAMAERIGFVERERGKCKSFIFAEGGM